MTDASIRLVCFDIGGVLVRICRSWPEGCTAAGLPIRDGVQNILQRETRIRRELVRLYQTNRIDTDTYCRRVSEAFDDLYRPDEIRAVHDAWLLGEYEGLTDIIDAIHDAGLETACLSNINHVHWRRMREYPAFMRLQHHFGSHEIGHHKPDPEIYEAMETSLGLAGSQILFFDDLEKNVEAAGNRGWHAVHVDHAAPMDVQITEALVEHGILSE